MQSSSDKAQTEPLAALVAVFALGVGLSLYVGVLDTTLPSFTEESEITPVAADALIAEASPFGVVRPPLDDAIEDARPTGYEMNATLRTDSGSWHSGPSFGAIADCVTQRVSVRTAPGTVRRGDLEVCVWTER